MGKAPRPPSTLRTAGRKFYLRFQKEYQIVDQGGLELLGLAAAAHDLAAEALSEIRRDGLTTIDKYQQRRPHPACSILRDARQAELSALRALHLDVEPLRNPGRPGSA